MKIYVGFVTEYIVSFLFNNLYVKNFRTNYFLDTKKREKKKKRVQFAEDVVDPAGNSEEFRRRQRNRGRSSSSSSSNKGRELQANRMALYNGILQNRVLHRTAYSSY